MVRSPCCEKLGLKKGPWAPEEDKKLLAYIEEHGHGSWRALPEKAGLQRCGKSCRLRWANYLRPDIKRGKFSLQEERTIIQLHALLGNRWSAIATHLARRTDNEIKNYWNTHLKKRLTKMGIDPVTHKPKCGTSAGSLNHMAQWESARLEAEARLVRESKLLSNMYNTNPFQPELQGFSTSAQLLHKAAAPPPLCLDVLKAWQRAFAAAGDLESPTSTLNFPENAFPNPIVSYSNALEAENDWKCLEKLINFPGNKEKMENLMESDDHMTYNSMDSVWIAELLSTASANAAVPSSLEGFADLLVDNSGDNNGSGGSCGGDFGGNDKYWNLVNFTTSDSPVF